MATAFRTMQKVARIHFLLITHRVAVARTPKNPNHARPASSLYCSTSTPSVDPPRAPRAPRPCRSLHAVTLFVFFFVQIIPAESSRHPRLPPPSAAGYAPLGIGETHRGFVSFPPAQQLSAVRRGVARWVESVEEVLVFRSLCDSVT